MRLYNSCFKLILVITTKRLMRERTGDEFPPSFIYIDKIQPCDYDLV